mmetsp:Transcript_57856/g.126823  ORF Transcript_57856/g.126823 Transcript_57856/m.126823 type:complete len:325 (+) Transcript_57856:304-1278(+)
MASHREGILQRLGGGTSCASASRSFCLGAWTAGLHQPSRCEKRSRGQVSGTLSAQERRFWDRLLLDQGLSPNEPPVSPLHKALREERWETAEYLLSAGANATVADVNGSTAMHFVNNVTLASALAERGAVVTANSQGELPLHTISARSRSTLVLSKLLDLGANLNARTQSGRTALHYAAEAGNLEAAEWLLEQGSDAYATDDESNSPLFLALLGGYAEMASVFAGSDVRDNPPLHAAAQIGNLTIVNMTFLMLPVSVDGRNADNQTPLHVAASFGWTDVVEFFIDRGANVSATDLSGQSVLMLSCQRHSAGNVRHPSVLFCRAV